MNQVRVLFFATFRERTGAKEVTLVIPDSAQVRHLKDQLCKQFPSLALTIDSAVVAVNRNFAFDHDQIPLGAEVAIFPPVSGGSEAGFPQYLAIIEGELDLNSLLDRITLPSTGAACIFSGMVRAETGRGAPHQTEYLEYEEYQPMAQEKLAQVANEIRERWPEVEGIAIVQRVGRLLPGTPTVAIACSSAHRDQGIFEAARYGIDRLKEIVPIWKKEVGPGGEEWVEGPYFPGRND